MNHGTSTDRLAIRATLHCLTGCGIGEVLGLVVSSALGWGTVAAIALAVMPAFLSGYSMTLALAVAFAAAYPVNRYLIGRGRGHALAHGHH